MPKVFFNTGIAGVRLVGIEVLNVAAGLAAMWRLLDLVDSTAPAVVAHAAGAAVLEYYFSLQPPC